ncbi:hypothetical protein DLAC_05265 [Tieghemostelium lacteum]|uniref:Uncharacterized protein n=1 Tax=Tieghemostelium lacteum TaxID=361077 RepID=A0A151ZIY0_TIELA|nr:hypothetical protein DLAC_05265 [Tieghemostelium lacteum]|eukprot:KYQ93865.1 hypothetical protein DLAC_05265 [Tieghemostelium lacteum]
MLIENEFYRNRIIEIFSRTNLRSINSLLELSIYHQNLLALELMLDNITLYTYNTMTMLHETIKTKNMDIIKLLNTRGLLSKTTLSIIVNSKVYLTKEISNFIVENANLHNESSLSTPKLSTGYTSSLMELNFQLLETITNHFIIQDKDYKMYEEFNPHQVDRDHFVNFIFLHLKFKQNTKNNLTTLEKYLLDPFHRVSITLEQYKRYYFTELEFEFIESLKFYSRYFNDRIIYFSKKYDTNNLSLLLSLKNCSTTPILYIAFQHANLQLLKLLENEQLIRGKFQSFHFSPVVPDTSGIHKPIINITEIPVERIREFSEYLNSPTTCKNIFQKFKITIGNLLEFTCHLKSLEMIEMVLKNRLSITNSHVLDIQGVLTGFISLAANNQDLYPKDYVLAVGQIFEKHGFRVNASLDQLVSNATDKNIPECRYITSTFNYKWMENHLIMKSINESCINLYKYIFTECLNLKFHNDSYTVAVSNNLPLCRFLWSMMDSDQQGKLKARYYLIDDKFDTHKPNESAPYLLLREYKLNQLYNSFSTQFYSDLKPKEIEKFSDKLGRIGNLTIINFLIQHEPFRSNPTVPFHILNGAIISNHIDTVFHLLTDEHKNLFFKALTSNSLKASILQGHIEMSILLSYYINTSILIISTLKSLYPKEPLKHIKPLLDLIPNDNVQSIINQKIKPNFPSLNNYLI